MRGLSLPSTRYAPPDEAIAASLMAQTSRAAESERQIDAYARRLIEGIRANAGGLGGIEDFLHAYSLSTREGLALMVLAEALLRVPDAATADRLIEDKLAAGDWSSHHVRSDALLVSASAWTLGVTARIIHPGETPDSSWRASSSAWGCPPCARRRAKRCGSWPPISCSARPSRRRSSAPTCAPRCAIPSTCWARARTAADAERYFGSYAHAIDAIGAKAGNIAPPIVPASRSSCPPCIRASSRSRAIWSSPSWCRERSSSRARRAADLNFTVDAEEADRLELTLAVIAAVLADPSLAGWEGFGLAVQAYQKRAPAVIDWLAETARGCPAG